MRVPTAQPRARRSFRVRGWIIAAVVLLVVLLFSLRGLAGFYTDYLWFDSVGQSDTWRDLLSARIVPALVFTLFFFAVMLVNLIIADRIAPKYRAMGPEDELVERYQRAVAPYAGRIRVGIAVFFALVAGVGVSSQWKDWVLFTHRVDFGIEDPQFGMDVGFYVFQLPFLRFIADWLFAGLVIVLLVTAVSHYLNGGIRFQSPFQRVTPQVKAHLSVILAAMALVKTGQYWLARYDLNFSDRGVVEGASYTDVNAQLPALNLLIFISIVAAGLFIWNIFRRGWILPIIAVGLWAFISLVVGTIYPAGVQRFSVGPNEFDSEEPYIGRNIEATRDAFDLQEVDAQEFAYEDLTDPEIVLENAATIDNARLWDPNVIDTTYENQQKLETYYKLDEVDIDRYEIDGEMQQVVLSAREINRDDLPSQSWINRHVVYTHGYGLAASPSDRAQDDGRPEYLLSDVPLAENLPIDVEQPRIYFGEGQSGYALVGAEQNEFDYAVEGAEDATTRYDGDDGVGMSNIVRRAAFALRFGDINPLISSQVNGDTKILYIRDIKDRVETLAPFLHFDDDPYPAVVDGRIVWIIDGYTTTDKYPYAQSANGDGGLDHDFNYVRNSVKATVDAYEGTVTFYVVDDEDPLIQAYQDAFPDLFTDGDEAPDELRAHFRYPEDLFAVQTNVYTRYHVTEPLRFYQGNDNWLLSPDPGSGRITDVEALGEGTTATTNAPQDATSTGARMDPYYLNLQLPGEDEPSFLILQPFVPVSSGNALTRLSSFMVAKSDPGSYGEMTAFTMPEGEQVSGPVQVNNDINSTPDIAEQITLLSRGGSTVIQGSMQLIPVGDSIIYIRPYYVQGTGEGSFPLFRRVAVFTENREPVLANSIVEGLNVLFGLEPAPDETDEEPPPEDEAPSADATVQELLDEADQAYADAQEALASGDLGRYQDLIDRVGELIEQAQQAAAGESVPTTTSTPPQET